MSESPKNIKILIGRLRNLNGRVLMGNEPLLTESREVFKKLQNLRLAKTSDLELDHIEKTIKILEALPEDIKELNIGEYEKLQNIKKGVKEKEVGNADREEDVKQFIETKKEARDLKNQKPEKKIIDFEGETKKTAKQLIDDYRKATTDKKEESNLKEKVTQDLIKISENQPENVVGIINQASLTEEFNKEKLEKEINRTIKDPEKSERIVQKIEEVRAEILVENKAEEISEITYKKLKTENVPVAEEIKTELKKNILKSWREGDELIIPKELKGKEQGEIIAREAVKATENFKDENLKAVVNYRAMELGKEIGTELRKNGVKNEALIEEYTFLVNKLNNNPETIIREVNRSEAANFVENKNPDKSPGQIETSINEAQFMAKNVAMAPKKFNKYIGRYNQIRESIGAEKLPKLKEIRVTEKMAAIFKDNPGMFKLMNGAQRMVEVWEKVNAFPGSLIGKIGGKVVEKFGGEILERIGGQAAKDFAMNAAAVIAKEGTVQGIKSIATGIMGQGAVVAGEGAAGGGALAGAVAAFQALPVVGQVIAVVAAALMLLKPIIDGVKGVVSKITGLDMNRVKNFITDTLGLGKLAGGVGQFVVDIGTFLVGIPALLGLINFGSIIVPVVIFFFLGSFTYSMLQHNLISSIVPPDDTGGGEEIPTIGPWPTGGPGPLPSNFPPISPWPSGAPVPYGCPNMRPASGYFSQGPFAPGCSHAHMSSPAVDIGAGEETPIFATHPGVAVLGYDTIYGYYIDVHGNCEGKEFYTRYAHMPPGGFKVGNNAKVAAGQQIGVVDNTGSSTGNHLHYHIVGLDVNKFGQYLGLSPDQTKQIWGCCGPPWNDKSCQ